MKEFKFGVTTDTIIFYIDSRKNNNIRALPEKYFGVLLVKMDNYLYKNKWVIPGGFVELNETLEQANTRILKKETNLNNVYTEQIGAFSKVDRDPRGRVVTIAFMSLIDKTKLKSDIGDNASWFDIYFNEDNNKCNIRLYNGSEELNLSYKKKLVDKTTNEYEYISQTNCLGFDHEDILIKGINTLRKKVNDTDIAFNLMPSEFTIGELKQVYELILGRKLINSAFRRVIKDKVVSTDNYVKTGGHRPSCLFKYYKMPVFFHWAFLAVDILVESLFLGGNKLFFYLFNKLFRIFFFFPQLEWRFFRVFLNKLLSRYCL